MNVRRSSSRSLNADETGSSFRRHKIDPINLISSQRASFVTLTTAGIFYAACGVVSTPRGVHFNLAEMRVFSSASTSMSSLSVVGTSSIRSRPSAAKATHLRSSPRFDDDASNNNTNFRTNATRTTTFRAWASESDDDEDAVREFETLKELEKDMLAFQQQDLSNPEKQKQREKDMQKKQGVDAFKEAIDQFLLYDFFVILFILAWLVFGVGVRLGVYKQGLSYDEPVLGTWLFLWPFLFQPLLGVHMLATLVSPLIGKLKEKGILGEDAWQ